MMDEIRQLWHLLQPSSFWEDDRCRSHSFQMTNSVALIVDQELDGFLWQATWADGTSESGEGFSTTKEAKAALRNAMERRRLKLARAASTPAKVEMFP